MQVLLHLFHLFALNRCRCTFPFIFIIADCLFLSNVRISLVSSAKEAYLQLQNDYFKNNLKYNFQLITS